MINKIFFLIKKIVLSMISIYTFNLILFPLNIIIPINAITVLFVTVLGIPAIIGFCLFSLILI